jgi:hypothetical protein
MKVIDIVVTIGSLFFRSNEKAYSVAMTRYVGNKGKSLARVIFCKKQVNEVQLSGATCNRAALHL